MSIDSPRTTDDGAPETRTPAEQTVDRLRPFLNERGIDIAFTIDNLEHFIRLHEEISEYVECGGTWNDARGTMFLNLLQAMSEARAREQRSEQAWSGAVGSEVITAIRSDMAKAGFRTETIDTQDRNVN